MRQPSALLWQRPMLAVTVAQFLSALADNAILIAAVALLKQSAAGPGMIPLLQQCFVLPYIVLAPFVGAFADALPKGRVMFIGNGLKILGTTAMLLGISPLLSYALIGVGAAVYSPAKYGILGQLFSGDGLVKANGVLEASTIVAILLGVVMGGLLADHSVALALDVCLAAYLLAALVNLLIPRLPASRPGQGFHPVVLLRDFRAAVPVLWASRDIRFSLIGTGMFWGCGATLRVALFLWVPFALGVTDNSTPANLMGTVSVGIVLGAILAGLLVPLARADRAMIGGILLGPLIIALAMQGDLPASVVLLTLVGAAGGLFVVPLNALLQDRGQQSVGTGRALAVQNLFENLAMLLLVGVFQLLIRWGFNAAESLMFFGLLLAVSMLLLAWRRHAKKHLHESVDSTP